MRAEALFNSACISEIGYMQKELQDITQNSSHSGFDSQSIAFFLVPFLD